MKVNINMIKRLLANEKPIDFIAKQVGISEDLCCKIISDLNEGAGHKIVIYKDPDSQLPEGELDADLLNKKQKIELIKSLYKNGMKKCSIATKLNVTYSFVDYYTNGNRKEQMLKYKENMPKDQKFKYAFRQKVKRFQSRSPVKEPYSDEDALNYIKENPYCYISKEPIDIYDISTYSFDHYIPTAKGGSSELDNLRICKLKYNKMKQDLLFDEFIAEIKKLYEIHC